jgi:hypothetical protein
VKPAEGDELSKKRSKHVLATIAGRKASAPVDAKLEEQFATGRLYGAAIFFCLP